MHVVMIRHAEIFPYFLFYRYLPSQQLLQAGCLLLERVTD
jgi:hypothetical protein